ncbi:flagellin [Methylobacterium sp. 17Sr1-1]|uniref:flagellin N-terminal helical domain-containing protein n=1 Tax=Methylobacterium sp. 17Sr1-1 TaxID=2202826 RepID=UPI000D6F50B1|nr:flagellin [Methylobacterium sp. 17Sr1-1]AWN53593.1 flagellin [Methylobacterium sp. 17Sr1-1]
MTSLLTNTAAMTALTTLKQIGQNLDTTSNRVSTGQRVTSAADNAAYWSIATTVRTDNASLGAVKDALGLGSSAVDTAYNGVNSIITSLQNIRTKLQTALQPGVDRSKVQTEIAAIQNQMKAIADSSVSSGQNWLSVDSSDTTTYSATKSVIAGFSRGTNGNISFSTVDISVATIRLYDKNTGGTPATTAKTTGSTALSGTMDFSGSNLATFSLNVNGSGADTITLNATSLASAAGNIAAVTRQELVNAINNQIAATTNSKNKILASLDSSNRLVFETAGAPATSTGTGATISVTMAANPTVNIGYGSGATPTAVTAAGTAAGASAGGGVLDTGGANAVTSIKTFNTATGVATDDATIGNYINVIEAAIAKVTDAGTKLGASKTQIDGQKNFVDTLMKVNDRTIGTLVDADIEEESTKLKALQTQQQLAVQALSIANSSSQNVLSLFR